MSCCLVTLCIGDKYLQVYNKLFRKSHEIYAKKCGYDFEVITDYIGKPKHKDLLSMNKILVCDYNWKKDYDFIIFVDADVIINRNSPSLHNYYNFKNKNRVVSESQPDLKSKLKFLIYKGNERTSKQYYKVMSNHDIETDHVINTGVLVIQPKKTS